MKVPAQKDSLTVLYNHSCLKERLEVEVERPAGTNSPLPFMLLDPDNFQWLEAGLRRDGELINTIKVLLSMINVRHRYTYSHSEKVMEYAGLVVERLGLSKNECRELKLAAFLHDLGKIGISREILDKKGPLTEKEWDVIKRHPVIGADIVVEYRALHRLIPCILYHHERFDGTGYPEGLSGEAIPLGARIIAVADSFNAMTTDRPYKKGISFEEAVIELKRCAGSRFDPQIVNIFIGEITRYYSKNIV